MELTTFSVDCSPESTVGSKIWMIEASMQEKLIPPGLPAIKPY
jgi:hypothetical protein